MGVVPSWLVEGCISLSRVPTLKSQIAFRRCICACEGLYHTDVDNKMENIFGSFLNVQIEACLERCSYTASGFLDKWECSFPSIVFLHIEQMAVSIFLPPATAEKLSCRSAHVDGIAQAEYCVEIPCNVDAIRCM